MANTIGERLKETRLARKLSIAQVSQTTRIRAHYIEAMENDDFGAIPSRVQMRGFLRLYSETLELDGDSIIRELQGESPKTSPPGIEEISPPPPEPEPEPQNEAVEDSSDEVEESIDDLDLEEPAAIPQAETLSQFIFQDIGKELRERRELLSLTLTEIERHTHVRKHYLQAIEGGKLSDIPSSVQARGMITSYARFLDIDTDAILLRFAEGLQAQRIEKLPPSPTRPLRRQSRSVIPSAISRFLSIDLIFGIGLVIAMTAFAIWGANRIITLSQAENIDTEAKGPSISDVLLSPIPEEIATLEPSPTFVQINDPGQAIAGAGIAATPIPTIPSVANVQVIVSVVERTFLRVFVDGEEVFNGRADAGSAFPYEADERIEVLTGNGATIQIVYNQFNLGSMGPYGQVVDMVFTANGVQTPTPTIVPTATITPSPTRTPRPSATPRATRTPRATPTFEPGG